VRFAGLLAAALAACGGGGEDVAAPAASAFTPTSADISCGIERFREEGLRLVNARRAAGAACGDHGRFAPAPPLAWNARLEAAAYEHSADMAAKDYFSHDSADGRGVAFRIDASGYRWSIIAENIAAGDLDLAALVAGWMASPGHCANIMNAALRDMGLACAENARSAFGRYFTLDLGAAR
jgi:uncharacterized protein YkwD